jgi:hypothetical protein
LRERALFSTELPRVVDPGYCLIAVQLPRQPSDLLNVPVPALSVRRPTAVCVTPLAAPMEFNIPSGSRRPLPPWTTIFPCEMIAGRTPEVTTDTGKQPGTVETIDIVLCRRRLRFVVSWTRQTAAVAGNAATGTARLGRRRDRSRENQANSRPNDQQIGSNIPTHGAEFP